MGGSIQKMLARRETTLLPFSAFLSFLGLGMGFFSAMNNLFAFVLRHGVVYISESMSATPKQRNGLMTGGKGKERGLKGEHGVEFLLVMNLVFFWFVFLGFLCLCE